MSNKLSLGELGILYGQADVLMGRLTESGSQIGHKEHTNTEREKEINRIESLRSAIQTTRSEIDGMKKQVSQDESKLNEIFRTLKDNGVPVPGNLQHTIVSA